MCHQAFDPQAGPSSCIPHTLQCRTRQKCSDYCCIAFRTDACTGGAKPAEGQLLKPWKTLEHVVHQLYVSGFAVVAVAAPNGLALQHMYSVLDVLSGHR